MLPKEAPGDATARRERERWTFFLREVAPQVFAFLFLLAAGTYCFTVLLNSKSPEAQQRAWAIFSTLLTGVLGYFFGKNAK